MAKVFISYNHQQEAWVVQRLAPCLEAGGAEVLIDRQRFAVGQPVVGQMDAWQDQADRHLLVLSPEYLASPYCAHEMARALQRRPTQADCVVPVLRHACALPAVFSGWNPLLYADLIDDCQSAPWVQVLQACDADLGCSSAPAWLSVRDELVRYLQRGQSVNLVAARGVPWQPLLRHLLGRADLPGLVLVNLEDPDTASRRGLLATIGQALGARGALHNEARDLADFKTLLQAHASPARVILTHFDLAQARPYYDVDLFAAWRYLIMESRKLVLLVQSRTPFDALLPRDHPLSDIDIRTVELGRQA